MSKDERHKTKVPFALRLLSSCLAKQREAALISLKHVAGVYLFGNVVEAAVVTVGDDGLRA